MPENLESTTTMPESLEMLPLINQFNDSDDEFIEEIVTFVITTAI
jgi:hypothetical protein